MIQEILIWTLFGLATLFIGRKIYLDFTAKDSCPQGCGNCEISNSKVVQMSSSIKSIK